MRLANRLLGVSITILERGACGMHFVETIFVRGQIRHWRVGLIPYYNIIHQSSTMFSLPQGSMHFANGN